MELLSILFKINVSLLIFYLVYRWVLRRLTFYNFNRAYLLSGIMISALLPFLQGNAAVHTGISKMQQALGMHPGSLLMSMKAYGFWNLERIALSVYWSGVGLMGLIFLIQLVSLLLLFLRSKKGRLFGYAVRILQEQSPPFSFFRGIFINPSRHSSKELWSVLQHEAIHVHQWHSVDIILGEIKRIFCWFNPAAWLMLSAIRENLEFIADRKVLQGGMDARVYQYTLLSVQQPACSPLMTNNFNFSHLKLRITMMNKRKSSDLHLMKYLLAVPVIAMACMLTNYANAQAEQGKEASRATITVNGLVTFDLKELENLSDEELEKKLGMKKEDIKTVEIKSEDKSGNEEGTGSVQKLTAKNIVIGTDENVDIAGMKLVELGDLTRNLDQLEPPEKVQKVKIVQKENDEIAYFLDGVRVEDIAGIQPNDIEAITVLKGATAQALYPDLKEKKGIILIESKNGKTKTTIRQPGQSPMKRNIALYPNPTDGILNLDIGSEHSGNTYEIFDPQGKKVLGGKLKSKNTIHTAHLKTGTYIIKMIIDGQSESMKFEVVR